MCETSVFSLERNSENSLTPLESTGEPTTHAHETAGIHAPRMRDRFSLLGDYRVRPIVSLDGTEGRAT